MANGRFDGKVVLVTGGAGAIGSAACRRFASEGATIVVVDRDGTRAEETAQALRASGYNAIGVAADVGDEIEAEAAIAAAISAFGRLDIVFNNAGISGKVAPVYELSIADWDEIVRINLRGIFLIQRFALRAMIEAKTRCGSIINMSSSMAGWDVLAGGAGYASTKHAVLGLTKVAAFDVARYGIRVNAVCPGVIETTLGVPAEDQAGYRAGIERFANRIPLRRIGQPGDVAGLVAFLASDDALHITGAGYLIDGGQTMQSWANAPEADAYPLVR
ncbi:SDR family NAD(P)-dependent oxidoreductase [Kaistia dalseonensis]|uniref:NAD(P)-dependent dehydrogenase (Short-subunit alcohol dehydrogenase family) n=1 Tax=Kaistia dalseonensis TaxID=410840 RepID=A0ABU0HAN9_9HYPH|nr:SDR family NAD(P)-dependent oxidoreductase [Kaistia dalseonensis]MCX5496760.1 SDR family NAD(P)-dependent oxidoreductase [Kaistia dalseonensis]MDQ0439385.1 NAD(P)-dependent dehydrogenase (short-subunit alcohol dehydrogenase family) [Kaistia dalseonensis]